MTAGFFSRESQPSVIGSVQSTAENRTEKASHLSFSDHGPFAAHDPSLSDVQALRQPWVLLDIDQIVAGQ